MRDAVTTALDLIALVLVTVGLIGYLYQWVGPLAFVVGGLLMGGASLFAARQGRKK